MKPKSGTPLRLMGVAIAVALLALAVYRSGAYGYYLDETGSSPVSPYSELLWLNFFLSFAVVGVMAAMVVERNRVMLVIGSTMLAATIALQLVVTVMTP
jgi:hypothetical protein